MRGLARFLGIGALLLPITGAPAARAETLDDMARRAEEWGKRIEQWVRLAERDWRMDKIEQYKRQEDEDFNAKDHVTAQNLWDFVIGKDLTGKVAATPPPPEVRAEALKLLEAAGGKTYDKDLSVRKQGGKVPRVEFARRNLLPSLKAKSADRVVRGGADRILRAWFMPQVPSRDQADVKAYDPDNEKTWIPAFHAWNEVL